MATYEAQVRPALKEEQQDLLDHPEHCSADAAALAGIGRAAGHQVRVRLVADPPVFGLYTVGEVRDETPDGVVRMGRRGRERLGTADPFAATVDSVVPRQDLSDAEAERLGEFVERLRDDGTHRGLIAVAPHGGHIEPRTDTQAVRVARNLSPYGVSTWLCKGFGLRRRGAAALHIASVDIHPASFPALNAVTGRGFRYAVAFHGFREDGVLVSGGAPFRLKAEIAAAIEDAVAGSAIRVRIAGPDDVFDGDNPRNIVNRLTADGHGGIQLEQSLAARDAHALDIADAVAHVFAARLAHPPDPEPWWRRLLRPLCALRHPPSAGR
jgi:phage replication-related protein YjqB (UPF0714/DUF867 family)